MGICGLDSNETERNEEKNDLGLLLLRRLVVLGGTALLLLRAGALAAFIKLRRHLQTAGARKEERGREWRAPEGVTDESE